MNNAEVPESVDCGITKCLEIIGGKWKPCLILNINRGYIRPSQLQKSIPNASRRVLNQQLKELQEHGMITRKVYHELPPKVEYYLTDLGKSLLPIISVMDEWGDQFFAKSEVYSDDWMNTSCSDGISNLFLFLMQF
ncbi:winged helix-turn-helix transcriptional regulator [Fulvivirga sediminis]|uniref:Helix-turn-helix transcriptional regulator n=1 Tax=Fulvivirga sediminis TaxID=2803949 RepID=A0A937JZA5_9BACT|nr:helix-turn-helix domain-containing protein [Fulvivirga sediminis]MBL3657218.1 helix-turn-helix transcriptional regulator [Fulvivirga sediminis]